MSLDTKTLDAVAAVGSRLEKERLLARLDEGSLKFLRWGLDPAITFGVILDTEHQEKGWSNVNTSSDTNESAWWNAVDKLCAKLASRELTGNAADNTIRDLMLKAPDLKSVTWACRILNKDLRAGFSQSTVNKVHKGFLEPFAVALAKPYDPDKHEIRGAWCVEPKLDGLRMVVIGGQAFTRNGREIDSVGHILQELEPWKDIAVFDGEIMGATEFNEDSGNIRRKGEGPNLTLKYNVFDCIKIAEWRSRKTRSFAERRQDLRDALGKGTEFVKPVASRDLKKDPTSEELFALRDYFIGAGYEGAMIKNMDAEYIFKRSDNILKLKDFQDADGTVTSWYEGKGRHKGRLGGLIAKFDGVETRVGSGFSDEQRDKLWEMTGTTDLIGKVIEVQYQNKTPDGSLRFPVFIKFRPDKE